MKSLSKNILLILTFIVALSGCKKEDPTPSNEMEAITTVRLTLTDQTGTDKVLMYKDLDGTGGNAPIITVDPLDANRTYTGVLDIFDENSNPTVNVNEEIQAESADHQVFYTVSNGLSFSYAYTDQDINGNPVGLGILMATGNPGSGSMNVTMRHQPSKAASGVADGEIDNAGGITDFDVNFNIVIR